ncbi:hypothetical protein Tco_1353392 [Tanacetum coccineum]
MSSNSDDIQAAGSDTRPPMLDRTDYESWSQRIRLYCRGKENGLQILQSIDQGPFELGTTRDALRTTPEGGVLLGPERPRTYEDLSDTEKKRYDADVRATNIVLQGLPKDIYKLINHNIEAKAIWDNVKMLLAGSELIKEDRESQLYDEFERFKMLPGENINEYYVRFHKLVNDMRNIRMTMPNIQLNSKFVNNMSPEWDRFVTAVKLNKGLKETNHEQLYAYLKQHEKHAAQDRLIIERITPATNDQLAFVSTVQPHAQSSHVQAALPQTNNQLRTSSNTRNQATIQDGRAVVQNVQGRQNQNQRYFARGNGTTGNGGAQNRAGNANAGQGKPVKYYNYNGVGYIARNFLDEDELLFLAGEQGNTFDADVDNQPVQDLALNEDNIFQADECDAFDSDVDDEPTAQSIFMANLSSVRVSNQDEHEIHNKVQPSDVIDTTSVHIGNSNVIPYEQYLSVNDIFDVPSCASSALNSVCVSHVNDAFVPQDPIATELKIYKEQVAIYEQRAKFELTEREQRMDDQMHMLIQNRNKTEEHLKKELHSFKLQLKSTMENNKIIREIVTTLKQKQGISELAQKDLEGPAYEIVKVFHPDIWIEEECKYDVAAMAVRTHMRIISVVRIEVFPMYGYNYMKKIILRRADLKEYVIAERDFKYLYPSDFEDLYLLNLQGHLNHLSPEDKKILTTAVNLWTRNLVIRQRIEDFQLGIESYQTQLNLTKPRWDAKGFEYKHDFTVIDSPRVVTFRDKYGVQMIMRFNEIHKFSDGTLHQIDEVLDYRVKEFRVNRRNPGQLKRPTSQLPHSDKYYHDPEEWSKRRSGSQNINEAIFTTRIIKRFKVDGDLKESSKITQVQGAKITT